MTTLLDAIASELDARHTRIAELEQEVAQLGAEISSLRDIKERVEQLQAGVPDPPPSVPKSAPRAARKPAAKPRAKAPAKPKAPAANGRGEKVPSLRDRIVAVLNHREDASIPELVEVLGDVTNGQVGSTIKRLRDVGQVDVVVKGRPRHSGRYAIATRSGSPASTSPNGSAPSAATSLVEADPDPEPAPASSEGAEPEPASPETFIATVVESNGERAARLMRSVLNALEHGAFSVRDIAEEIGLDPADTALVVRKLQTMGKVVRTHDGRYALADED